VTSPAQRRRDPQPVSRAWELALLAVAGGLSLLAIAALLGLGAASAVFGGGWVWPPGGPPLIHTLGGLLAGHPGSGLPAPLAARVPGAVAVYLSVGVSELAMVAAAVVVGRVLAGYVRPNDARGGMASRSEAQDALGVGQLRGAKAIIRPDLYGRTRRATPATTDADAQRGEE
jgi:hypothetical protein